MLLPRQQLLRLRRQLTIRTRQNRQVSPKNSQLQRQNPKQYSRCTSHIHHPQQQHTTTRPSLRQIRPRRQGRQLPRHPRSTRTKQTQHVTRKLQKCKRRTRKTSRPHNHILRPSRSLQTHIKALKGQRNRKDMRNRQLHNRFQQSLIQFSSKRPPTRPRPVNRQKHARRSHNILHTRRSLRSHQANKGLPRRLRSRAPKPRHNRGLRVPLRQRRHTFRTHTSQHLPTQEP